MLHENDVTFRGFNLLIKVVTSGTLHFVENRLELKLCTTRNSTFNPVKKEENNFMNGNFILLWS